MTINRILIWIGNTLTRDPKFGGITEGQRLPGLELSGMVNDLSLKDAKRFRKLLEQVLSSLEYE
jgi:hypothetical protein